jgi:hypothetical protein
MVIVKASAESEAGVMPSEDILREMGNYNDELVKAGIMLAGEGLHPTSRGKRMRFSGKSRTVIDGPFTESKELVAGYTLIDVPSREAALEWTRRFPNPAVDGKEAEIEVRQLFKFDDFGPSEAMERFRELGVGGGATGS